MSATLLPGDVIVVHHRTPFALGVSAKLRSGWNHVAVVYGTDAAGKVSIIEARLTGVAWRPLDELPRRYLHNADQPKTDEQRQTITAGMTAMLKVAYDWTAIEKVAFTDLERQAGVSWDMPWDGPTPPAHVICSSLASYWYAQAGLAGPHSWRSTPLDWATFTQRRGWEHP